MKLVYLDTSNFSLLSDVKVSQEKKYYEFVEKWENANLTLAFSIAHLDELLRLEQETSRDLRFQILEDFLPFRFENMLSDKEILSFFLENNLFELKFKEMEVFPKAFSKIVFDKNDLDLLRGFDVHFYREILEQFNFASSYSWQAFSQSHSEKNQKLPRLSDMQNFELTPEMIQSIRTMIENLDVGFSKDFLGVSKEEINEAGNKIISELINNFLNKAQETSYFEAFSEFIGADATNSKTLKNPLQSLMENFRFEVYVSDFLIRVLEIEDSEQTTNFQSKIKITNCPGLWLSEQVKLQLKLAKDSKASNEKDIQHITHLPYVDVFFSDRRIVSATKQVLRKPELINSLKNISLPIQIANNIEALENSLFD